MLIYSRYRKCCVCGKRGDHGKPKEMISLTSELKVYFNVQVLVNEKNIKNDLICKSHIVASDFIWPVKLNDSDEQAESSLDDQANSESSLDEQANPGSILDEQANTGSSLDEQANTGSSLDEQANKSNLEQVS
jgi:hypothetical protein